MIVLGILLAVLAAGVAAPLKEAFLRRPPDRLAIENFRGLSIPAVGGIVIAGALLAAEAVLTLVALLRPGTLLGDDAFAPSAVFRTFGSSDQMGVFLVALGFFALGTLDDLAGAGRARGFSGHIAAIREGIVTGGVIKAVGGGTLAFVAAASWGRSLGEALMDAAIVALTANLVNLLDLRPGRAVKVFLVAWAPVGWYAWTEPYFPLSAVVVSAAAVWLPADLKQRGMLGDGGSNLLGAVLGAGLALSLPVTGRLVALGVLIGLTILSERWSFSSIIDATPPLRWLDRLGRESE